VKVAVLQHIGTVELQIEMVAVMDVLLRGHRLPARRSIRVVHLIDPTVEGIVRQVGLLDDGGAVLLDDLREPVAMVPDVLG
jgi:hypothetical protein